MKDVILISECKESGEGWAFNHGLTPGTYVVISEVKDILEEYRDSLMVYVGNYPLESVKISELLHEQNNVSILESNMKSIFEDLISFVIRSNNKLIQVGSLATLRSIDKDLIQVCDSYRLIEFDIGLRAVINNTDLITLQSTNDRGEAFLTLFYAYVRNSR